jgi:hypothetical protein
MGVTLRPYDNPPPAGDVSSPFDASLSQTLQVLAVELRMLDARQIVLQVGYREGDLRLDGMPRATAKMLHDAVALSFESKWGPLRYETSEFKTRYWRSGREGWQENLRAVALAMEALRKVDRYGVSKRGEQYAGWKQLGTGIDVTEQMTEPMARAYLRDVWGGDIRRALFETHPDRGGDGTEFRKVQRARELTGAEV